MLRSIIMGSGNSSVTFAIAQTQLTSIGTSLTISNPGTTGDYLIAVMAGDGALTWTGDTGWTERADSGNAPSLRVATRVADGSASYTFTSNTSKKLSGCIIAIPGYTFDAIGAFSPDANPVVAPEVTVAANYSLLLSMFAAQVDGITFTAPSGTTVVATDAGANRPSYRVFYEPIQAGATGSRTSTGTGGTSQSGILLALKHV